MKWGRYWEQNTKFGELTSQMEKASNQYASNNGVTTKKQKLAEAQEIAEAVLDAEVKIGELTSKIERASKQNAQKQFDTGVDLIKPKAQTLEEIGIKQHTAERFERMAKHPETVEKAKADARAEGRIVTRADVLNRIAPPKSHAQTVREFKKQAREEHADVTDHNLTIRNI